MANRWAGSFGEWPKWIDDHCQICGEYVPRGHFHTCDNPKKAVDWEAAAKDLAKENPNAKV